MILNFCWQELEEVVVNYGYGAIQEEELGNFREKNCQAYSIW